MENKIHEYLARRMEGNQGDDTEMRRRRRSDGTFMRSNDENNKREVEYDTQGERGTSARYEHGRYETNAHRGPDDDRRRRIGFGQGKSHWSEEEFVGDMEESLYHEVDDIFHYLEVMEKVYNKGYETLASAFYEIANEKFICAEFLKHHLKKIGKYNPSEHKELEEDLSEVRKMFK